MARSRARPSTDTAARLLVCAALLAAIVAAIASVLTHLPQVH